MATGGEDGSLNLSNSHTGQKLHSFGPFLSADQNTVATVNDVVISNNQSEFVAGAYSDGFVRVFDFKSRKLQTTFRN